MVMVMGRGLSEWTFRVNERNSQRMAGGGGVVVVAVVW
jgi:hypothetical protein